MSLSAEDMRRIGGSDVAAIVGVNPYAGPLSVWMRIVEGVGQDDNSHTSRGRRLEPVVLDWYEEHTGNQVTRDVRLTVKDRPHVRASFDGLANGRGVEAKTANAHAALRWGEDGSDAIPMEYLVQVQHYLGEGLRSGRVEWPIWDVPALIAGDFRLYQVAYDAETYHLLSEAVDRFWVDHVVARKPPEPTVLPRDAESVARRFRRHEGEALLDFAALSADTQVVLEEYLRAYAEESAAVERLTLWEARAKLALGSAPGVRGLPETLGFHCLDWKAQKGKAEWKAVAQELARRRGLTHAQLSALAAENTGEGARPFIPRPITKKRGA